MRESDSTLLNAATPAEMQSWGRALAAALQVAGGGALVVSIAGELGAGKTTFVGGVLAAFGIRGPVRSPTYTLIEPYEVRERTLYHLDLYRLSDPREMENLGVRDLLNAESVLLVEWAERGGAMLPVPDLVIAIQYSADAGISGRTLQISANSEAGLGLLRHLRSVKHQESGLSP